VRFSLPRPLAQVSLCGFRRFRDAAEANPARYRIAGMNMSKRPVTVYLTPAALGSFEIPERFLDYTRCERNLRALIMISLLPKYAALPQLIDQ
jgi:hypothetical protein